MLAKEEIALANKKIAGKRKCPNCKGKGKLSLRNKALLQPCPYCNSTGKVKEKVERWEIK